MKKIVLLLCFLLLTGCGMTKNTSKTAESKTMKIASITNATGTSYEYVCEKMFANKISEYTNGEINAEYYPSSQLGSIMMMELQL